MVPITERELDLLLKDAVKSSELNLQEKDLSSDELVISLSDGINLRSRYWNLKEINISGSTLSLRGIEMLVSALTSLKTMESFIARGSQISKEAGIYLAKLLTHSAGLKTLDISGNHLGDTGLTSLCQAFAENIQAPQIDFMSIFTIKTLNLSHNDIGDAGILAFCRALIHYSKRLQAVHRTFRLKTVKFTGNKLTDKAAYCLGQLLNMKFSPGSNAGNASPSKAQGKGVKFNMIAEEVHLDDNPQLTCKGIATLLGDPQHAEVSPIRTLSISKNNLDFSLFTHLANILQYSPVQYLDTLIMEFTEEMAKHCIQVSGASYDPIYGSSSPKKLGLPSSSLSVAEKDSYILHLSMKKLVDALLNITHKQTVKLLHIQLGKLHQSIYEMCIENQTIGQDFVFIDCKKTLEIMNPASEIFGIPYISNIDAWIAAKEYQNVLYMTTSSLRKLSVSQQQQPPQQSQESRNDESDMMNKYLPSNSTYGSTSSGRPSTSSSVGMTNDNDNNNRLSSILRNSSLSSKLDAMGLSKYANDLNNNTANNSFTSSNNNAANVGSTQSGGILRREGSPSRTSNRNVTIVDPNPVKSNDFNNFNAPTDILSQQGVGSSNRSRSSTRDANNANNGNNSSRNKSMEDLESHNYSLIQMKEQEYLKMRQDHSQALQTLSKEVVQLFDRPNPASTMPSPTSSSSTNPITNSNPNTLPNGNNSTLGMNNNLPNQNNNIGNRGNPSNIFDNLLEFSQLPQHTKALLGGGNTNTVTTEDQQQTDIKNLIEKSISEIVSQQLHHLLPPQSQQQQQPMSQPYTSHSSSSLFARNTSPQRNPYYGTTSRSRTPSPTRGNTASSGRYSNYPTTTGPSSPSSPYSNSTTNNAIQQLTNELHTTITQQKHFEDFILSKVLELEQKVMKMEEENKQLKDENKKLQETMSRKSSSSSGSGVPSFSDGMHSVNKDSTGANTLVLNELWQRLHLIEKSMVMQQQQQQLLSSNVMNSANNSRSNSLSPQRDRHHSSAFEAIQSSNRKQMLARMMQPPPPPPLPMMGMGMSIESNNPYFYPNHGIANNGYYPMEYDPQQQYYPSHSQTVPGGAGLGQFGQVPEEDYQQGYGFSSDNDPNNIGMQTPFRSNTPTSQLGNPMYTSYEEDKESIASIPVAPGTRRRSNSNASMATNAATTGPSTGNGNTASTPMKVATTTIPVSAVSRSAGNHNTNPSTSSYVDDEGSVQSTRGNANSNNNSSKAPPKSTTSSANNNNISKKSTDLPPFPVNNSYLDTSQDMFATTLRPQSHSNSNSNISNPRKSTSAQPGFMMPTRSAEFKRHGSSRF